MFFSRPIQWYHSHADPIWPDGTFKFFIYSRQAIQHDEISVGHHDKESCRSYHVKKLARLNLE